MQIGTTPEQYRCSLEPALDVIGGKWKGIVLFHLMDGTQRFNQLRRLVPAVTHKMLAQHLRELERDGLITRTAYAEVPPRVEYSLSEFGGTLEPILLAMRDWGIENIRLLESNRARSPYSGAADGSSTPNGTG